MDGITFSGDQEEKPATAEVVTTTDIATTEDQPVNKELVALIIQQMMNGKKENKKPWTLCLVDAWAGVGLQIAFIVLVLALAASALRKQEK